jgi:protein-S-isoprenylcysteine O-methyltransferase Ste14
MNSLGIAVFFAAMAIGRHCWPQGDTVRLATGCLLVTVVPLWLYDFIVLKVHRRPSTALRPKAGPVDQRRVVTKLIGLYGTFLIILVLYHLNPVFLQSPKAAKFYSTFFVFLGYSAPWVIALSFVYFRELDRRQKDPYDGYWHMGCLLTGRRQKVNGIILAEHAKVWFIKAFFLPFLVAVLVSYMNLLFAFNWKSDARTFILLYNHLLNVSYTMDVVYGVLGYILTVRLLDTHIQSTEPTLLGWAVCLACYNPFLGITLLPYEDNFQWEHWFALDPGPYYTCGILIILLSLVVGLATVAIGYRMSNLTYRGIITTGPYRFTKHPAYLCKVLSWWIISLPFLSTDGTMASMIHTFNLSIISGIYYLRAKTEENHLSNYPEYVAYANWINEHGMFSFLGKIFPSLKYSEEECKQWKSVVWFKKLKP